MKIKGRCRSCGRDFPADMLLANSAAGHCPFCGIAMDPHYGSSFTNALEDAQRVGSMMEGALAQLAALGVNFELDRESVLEPIRGELAKHDKVERPA
ncbi:MAG: hypothetical protein NVSMB57_10960 [Actinomycetota bacterium]